MGAGINRRGRELMRRTNEKQDFRVRLDFAGVWERVDSVILNMNSFTSALFLREALEQ